MLKDRFEGTSIRNRAEWLSTARGRGWAFLNSLHKRGFQVQSLLAMPVDLPSLQLPADIVPFPGCELRLPLLPEARGPVAAALAASQRLILRPDGADVGVIARIHSLSTEPEDVVVFRPICRVDISTRLPLPEVEDVDDGDPQVIEVLQLARDYLRACQTNGWFDPSQSPSSVLDAVACYGSLPTVVRRQVLEGATWDSRVSAILPTIRQAAASARDQPAGRWQSETVEGIAPPMMAAEIIRGMEAAGVNSRGLQQARRRLDILVQRCKDRDSAAPGILNYAFSLPWETSAPEVEVSEARKVLNLAHLGHEHVKRRVLEDLAVRSRARQFGKDVAGPIICLVGEPGTGKTSMARLIAQAMNRPWARISLGGVSEALSLVGTPSQYRRSGPGLILEAVRKSGSFAAVIVLDEIDKLGGEHGENGNPALALLALLDPEQRDTFTDQYLDLVTPMSRAVFVATANDLSRVPGPLRDRLEVLELPGYDRDERIRIGRLALLPESLEAAGVTEAEVTLKDDAIELLAGLDNERGVRQLRRNIEAVVRRAVVQLMEEDGPVVVDASLAQDWLEKPVHVRTQIGFRVGTAAQIG